MERIVKENYYLDIAETVLERSTCLRRQYGAIIVRNDEIVATGYNGAPRGRKNCSDLGYCVREQMRVPRGERYELCRSVHAEANAIISASRNECIGGDIYLVGHDAKTGAILSDATSCSMCRRICIRKMPPVKVSAPSISRQASRRHRFRLHFPAAVLQFCKTSDPRARRRTQQVSVHRFSHHQQ